MRYANADTTSSDEACFETIIQGAESTKKHEEASRKEYGKPNEIGRYGKISFDAIQCGVGSVSIRVGTLLLHLCVYALLTYNFLPSLLLPHR